MDIASIKDHLIAKGMFLAEGAFAGRHAVVGYEQQFRLEWLATRLHTFVVAANYEPDTITVASIEELLHEGFTYANRECPARRGIAVIAILLSSSLDQEAIRFCMESKAGKQWGAIAVPVVVDTASNHIFFFNQIPIWGALFFPYFHQMIDELSG